MKFDVKFGVVYKGGEGGGGSDKSYIHEQTEPKSTWIINHNLGKYPCINLVDDNNIMIMGEIEYISENEIIARFNKEYTGKAILN